VKSLNKKHTPYSSYINFNIIIPNMSTCSFHCVFYTKHFTPHTICVCLSSLPTPACCPMLFFAIKQKPYCTPFCVQREPVSLCSWTTVALHCADSGEVPHRQNAVDSCLTPVTQTQHLQSPCFKPAVLYTHPLTLTLYPKSYYWQLNSNISLTLYIRHTSLYTMHVIPRPTIIVINP
jgi:hypothetical protein